MELVALGKLAASRVRYRQNFYNMADAENLENIAEAVKLTQKIRASISKTYSGLSDGFHNSLGNEKQCLSELQKSLLIINNDFK